MARTAAATTADPSMTDPPGRPPHDPEACEENHCHARKKQGEPGDTCTQAAGWGTDHVGLGRCKLHGGSSPSGRHRALAEAAREDAESVLAHHGVHLVDDPVAELGKLASSALAMTEALAERVNALKHIRYSGDEGGEQLRAEVQLYERFLDRSGRLLDVLAKHQAARDGGDPDQRVESAVRGILAVVDAVGGVKAAAE